VGHLSPLHPVLDWLADKVLVSVARNQAPVIVADVEQPTFCVQGLYANGRGQPQLVEWLAVSLHRGRPNVGDLFEVLRAAGVRPGMANPGGTRDTKALAAQLPKVIDAARDELARRRAERDAELDRLLAEPAQRLKSWADTSKGGALALAGAARDHRLKRIHEVERDTSAVIESLRTRGEPLVRVLAVVVGRQS
jgi:hypothetical protein